MRDDSLVSIETESTCTEHAQMVEAELPSSVFPVYLCVCECDVEKLNSVASVCVCVCVGKLVVV